MVNEPRTHAGRALLDAERDGRLYRNVGGVRESLRAGILAIEEEALAVRRAHYPELARDHHVFPGPPDCTVCWNPDGTRYYGHDEPPKGLFGWTCPGCGQFVSSMVVEHTDGPK